MDKILESVKLNYNSVNRSLSPSRILLFSLIIHSALLFHLHKYFGPLNITYLIIYISLYILSGFLAFGITNACFRFKFPSVYDAMELSGDVSWFVFGPISLLSSIVFNSGYGISFNTNSINDNLARYVVDLDSKDLHIICITYRFSNNRKDMKIGEAAFTQRLTTKVLLEVYSRDEKISRNYFLHLTKQEGLFDKDRNMYYNLVTLKKRIERMIIMLSYNRNS